MQINGSCHCGNIRFRLIWPDGESEIQARACACSFCRKHGGLWTSKPEAELHGKVDDASRLRRYRFGTQTAEFFLCSSCGVPPFVVSSIDDHQYAVVNVNTFEGPDLPKISSAPRDFEGEATKSRLDRRQSNWIANVRIDV